MKPIKFKKIRIPRKLKKELKKDPYYCIFGAMWISNIKFNIVSKEIKKFWNIPTLNIASVRDTGESI